MKTIFALVVLLALGTAHAQTFLPPAGTPPTTSPPANVPPATQPPVTPPPIPTPEPEPPATPPPTPTPATLESTWFAATCWSPIVDGQPFPGPVKRFVAANGKYTTRPAYPIVNGLVGTKEAARAPIGAACDCYAITITKGSTTYCAAPPPNAALVTVCREH